MAQRAPLSIAVPLERPSCATDGCSAEEPSRPELIWTLQCALYAGVERAYGARLACMVLNDLSRWPGGSPEQVIPELEIIRSTLVQHMATP